MSDPSHTPVEPGAAGADGCAAPDGTPDRRLDLLLEASETLLASLDSETVVAQILELSRRLIAADAYAVWRREPQGTSWRAAADAELSAGYSREIASTPIRMPDEPLLVEDVTNEPLLAGRQETYRKEGIRSLLCVPLRIHGESQGTIAFYYRQPTRFSPIDVRVGSALANLAASALGSVELYEEQRRARLEAETAQQRLAFLAEASSVLAASLDYRETLREVAHLAVPHLADYCSICLLEPDGGLRLEVIAHRDPRKIDCAREIEARYPMPASEENPRLRVLRTGRSELYAEIAPEELAARARDEEHLALLREIAPVSSMLVPLSFHGRPLGTVTFTSAESGYRYGPADLLLAEDLAARAANAIEHARLFEAAQHALEALAEADRRKDHFLAMLGHELRNPLAAISNAVYVLEQGGPHPPEVAHRLAVMDRQTRQLRRLVDDLLDVSRINQGKIELRKSTVTLAQVLQCALDSIRPLAQQREQRLSVKLPPSPILLEADPSRVEQVFANLLNNAVKYTPNGGSIDVEAEAADGSAVVRIRDTGNGIQPELLPRIFEPFIQGEPAVDRAAGGLGIGLTLVRSLVELHGGRVEARSGGPGEGSEFTVRLPGAAHGEQRIYLGTGGSAGSRRGAPSPRRILVVEDSPDAAETLADLLGLWGHEVRVVSTGQAAIREVVGYRPEVVLCDIGLPGMNGYDVARHLRTESGSARSTPLLVALTGFGQEEDRRLSREAGYDHHLVKPIDPAELQRLLLAV
jgi:signal transduction histidine kinase